MASPSDRTARSEATTTTTTTTAPPAPAAAITVPSRPTPLPTDSHLHGADNWGVWQVQMRGMLGIDYTVSSTIISCQQGVVHHIQHCPHDAFSYWVAFREAFAPTDAQGALRLLRCFWRVSLPAATPEAFDCFSKEFTEVLSALKAADVDLTMVYSSHLLTALPPALDSLQTTISVSNPPPNLAELLLDDGVEAWLTSASLPSASSSPCSATLDSGASHSMCGDASLFANLRWCKPSPVGGIGGNANALIATGVGALSLRLRSGRFVVVKNALLV
ncbi:hypothetical protein JCM5296_001736, partial [Sporobolomyces johnsonii]